MSDKPISSCRGYNVKTITIPTASLTPSQREEIVEGMAQEMEKVPMNGRYRKIMKQRADAALSVILTKCNVTFKE